MADAPAGMGDDEVTRLLADDVQAGAAFVDRKDQAECVAAVRRMCARHRETGTWDDVTYKKMKAHGVTVQKQMFCLCKRVAKHMTSAGTAHVSARAVAAHRRQLTRHSSHRRLPHTHVMHHSATACAHGLLCT